ncbi:MAG TPA: hypothetical protein VFE51_00555 [Verrucomicrobiae bacterium]|nr:hypothetical protein [Verrucomicrobiae bacterium]
MSWFLKKADPISDRARSLSAQIASLEAQIKTLDGTLQQQNGHPRLRSTTLPQATALQRLTSPTVAPPQQPEPVFEEIDVNRLNKQSEGPNTAAHYNELGVRKYDLPALLRRWRNHFRGPAATNPKLVSYLAAGGIQGLRPLRYEKRVARNRFIVFVLFLFLMLLGLAAAFLHRR